MLNKKLFAETITIIGEIVGKKLSDAAGKVYYESMKHLSGDDFKRAAQHLITTRKYTSFPMPAEILEFVKGDDSAACIAALYKIENAMREHGAYTTVIFDDPRINAIIDRVDRNELRGWPALCSITLDEYKWWVKDFEKAYRAFNHNHVPVSHPLIGLHKSEDVTYIGEVSKCQTLIAESDKSDKLLKQLEG